ncbi:MAG: ATPase [Clostridia bacterium]|nr:ATPase [Clostridia bacterium]
MDLKALSLGIELGSTRIKAVLIDENFAQIAQGSFEWENKLLNGIWTYSLDEIHEGLQKCYADLKKDFEARFPCKLTTVGAIGVSAMMHGYMPFDETGELLCPFRTWRNTITGEAAAELTDLFGFNIPQRWSIAHLYQAVLNGEEHVPRIYRLCTLAAYIHWKLTGKFVVGVGEASGMFPINSDTMQYDEEMVRKFDLLISGRGFAWDLKQVLPSVAVAGEDAGQLTDEGAAFLDISGDLEAGVPFAPCEGDAGTGMVATNSITVQTGNVSAGTSDFAMIVVDKKLNVHREIDMVTTPDGKPVAMVHCNNCTSDINAWVEMIGQAISVFGYEVSKNDLYTKLFECALEGDVDCGGLLSFNYYSGEGVTDLDEGRPIFLRTASSKLTIQNFMRNHLLSALATLKIGLDILQKEGVQIRKIYGHGGYFKTPIVGQRMLSAAVGTPVSVMETAAEGGPYGMAVLAAFEMRDDKTVTLEQFLEEKVFADCNESTIMATDADIAGFSVYLSRYKRALPVEKEAIASL